MIAQYSLVKNLRHSRYLSTDIHADIAAIDLAKDIYLTLKDISERELQIGEALAQHQINQWNQEWSRMRPVFALIDKLCSASSEHDEQIGSLKLVVTDREQQIADLRISVAAREARVVSVERVVAECEVQIENLRQAVLKHEKENECLHGLLREREAEVGCLNRTIAESTGKIVGFDATVAERDAKIFGINQSLSESESQCLKLTRMNMEMECAMADIKNALTAQDAQIKALQQTIQAIYQSRSWRITKFIRQAGIFRFKFRDVLAAIYRFRQRESLYVLLKKSLRIWWCEGWEGLKLRIRREHCLGIQMETETLCVPPAFTPSVEVIPTAIVQDIEGFFSLAPAPQGYTYIQPQFPPDLKAKISELRSAPSFSIVVPVYNTTNELLEAVIASVKSQWYPHWQLVLADDASTAEDTCRALATIDDPQIKVLKLESNEGIAGATNFALSVADGDFVVFMDHDDELTVDCLYELALCIDREKPDFIYSDEDKLTEDGKYIEPHFKPDWSPDTMMSTMFTCHVSCVRRSLLQKVGGLRSEYDGCQDWDFVLRVSEQTDRISHISKVLYHWRIIPESIASDIAAKPYVLEASRRVREDAVIRRGLAAVIEPLPQMVGYFRVAYKLLGDPLISIIIPTRDNEKMLRRCIDSIFNRTTYRKFELIILDNGSIDSAAVIYLQQLRETEGVTVIRHDAPFNFSELNNIGARASSGELLLFLNDDTEVLQEDWLERMGGFAQLRHIGAVGAKLLYPEIHKVQHSGVLNLEDGPGHAFLLQDADSPGYYMRNLLEYNWLAVTGACLMVSRDKFFSLDGFCESLPIAYNDIDLCMRLRDSGFYNVVCQAVRLTHHESVSRGVDHIDPVKMVRLRREKAHLYERNYKYFQYDPFYNLNLHPNGINFEVAA